MCRQKQRWREICAGCFVALVSLPALVTVAVRFGRYWLPTQDLALIDLRVRDVWTNQIPLVGAYSRFGWSHFGPIGFYFLAIPSALAGRQAWATVVGGAAFQLVAIIWVEIVAWRFGKLKATVFVSLLLVLSYASVGTWIWLEPWNPHFAFPWFVLFAIYLWRVTLGETTKIPGFLISATVLMQLHVGYVQFVFAGLLIAFIYWYFDRRKATPWQFGRKSVVLSAAFMAFLWMPVIIDSTLHPPGNFVRVVKFFLVGSGGESTLGLKQSLGLISAPFVPPFQWISGTHQSLSDYVAIPVSSLWIVLPIGLLSLGLIVSVRSRRAEELRLLVIVACLSLSGIFALAKLPGVPEPYLFYWRIPLAFLVVLATFLTLWQWLVSKSWLGQISFPRVAMVVTLGLLLMAMEIPNLRHLAKSNDSIQWMEPSAQQLLTQIDFDQLRGKSIEVRHEGTTLGGLEAAIANEIDRRGIKLKVENGRGFQFGQRREVGLNRPDHTWTVVEESWRTSVAAATPTTHFVARVVVFPSIEEAELVELHTRLSQQFTAAGRSDLIELLDEDYVERVVPDLPQVNRSDLQKIAAYAKALHATGLCRCSIIES